MSLISKLVILLFGFLFFGKVLSLLNKRKINERNSIQWLAGTIVILLLAANPQVLDWAAGVIGIEYPPSLLFLLAALVLLYLSLHHSIQLSALHSQIVELTQNAAVEKLLRQEQLAGEKADGQ